MRRKTAEQPQPCSNEAAHTEGPKGYVEWHEWADEMIKTHDQTKCAVCGLYKIWTLKAKP